MARTPASPTQRPAHRGSPAAASSTVGPRRAPLPIVVIGAGLAGLTAAARLARAGMPVMVMESGAAPGGRARTTERDGFHLNLGPHALATRGPGTAVLRDLGIDLPGRSPTIVGGRFLRDGQVVPSIDRRRGGAGLRGGPALARFARAARDSSPATTVADVIERTTDDTATRAMLRAMARLMTYADGLERQSASVVAEVASGGWVRYLDEGWGSLVDQLRRMVETAGGVVRSAARVQAVELAADGGGPRVHLDAGEVLPAAAVIVATGGPESVAGLLEGEARRHVEAWAEVAVPVRLACLDVALRRRPDMPSVVLGADRPLYLSVHSDRSRIAPDGGAVVQLARYLDVGERVVRGAREELEGILDLVAKRWRDDVVHARFLPDLVVTHDAVLASEAGVRGRPGPAVPGAPGLFVAGDWVGPRGYLAQASLASAGAAADLAAIYARRSGPDGSVPMGTDGLASDAADGRAAVDPVRPAAVEADV